MPASVLGPASGQRAHATWLVLAWWVILEQVGLRLGRGFYHIPGVGQDRGPARQLRAQLLSLCDG